MRNAFLFLALILLQYGCEHDTSQLRMKLDSAVERHASIDERIIAWGTPTGKDRLSDGRFVYTWKIPWTGNYVNYAAGPGGQAYSVQHFCTIVITTSAENNIQSYSYRDC